MERKNPQESQNNLSNEISKIKVIVIGRKKCQERVRRKGRKK
jgi:hypothetical protein